MAEFNNSIGDLLKDIVKSEEMASFAKSAGRKVLAMVMQKASDLPKEGIVGKVLSVFFNNEKGVSNSNGILSKSFSGNLLSGDALKDISFDIGSLAKSMNIQNACSFVEIGLSCVNLAATVVGFIVISHQLNDLSADVKQVLHTVEKIANVQKNNLLSEYQKLIMRFNSMSSKIGRNEPVSMDELETLIIDMRAYISEMVMNLTDDAMETEIVLKVINALLPAYTQLFHEFMKRYFYEKESLPANYNMFLDLYREMDSEKFRKIIEEYLFVTEGRHNMEVLELTNIQMLIGVNHRTQIEDEAELLKTLGTRAAVEEYDRRVEAYVDSLCTTE